MYIKLVCASYIPLLSLHNFHRHCSLHMDVTFIEIGVYNGIECCGVSCFDVGEYACIHFEIPI